MLRPALTAGLMMSALAVSVALAAPAAAGGAHAVYLRSRAEAVPAVRHVRRHHRGGMMRFAGSPVRPVSHGETDGAVFHAWLPRNTDLPIYNVPPPYFSEP